MRIMPDSRLPGTRRLMVSASLFLRCDLTNLRCHRSTSGAAAPPLIKLLHERMPERADASEMRGYASGSVSGNISQEAAGELPEEHEGLLT